MKINTRKIHEISELYHSHQYVYKLVQRLLERPRYLSPAQEIFGFFPQIFSHLASSKFSRDSMSNQAGMRKPRFSVMGITGAVGQITFKLVRLDPEWEQICQMVEAFNRKVLS